MSIPFAVCFIAMMGFQAISIPSLHKQLSEEYRWGFYFMKFVALPLWFASTFAGALGIIPGLGLLLLIGIIGFVGMVVVIFLVLKQNPGLAPEITNKDENNPIRQRFMNYMSASWGTLLTVGTLVAILA